MKTATPIHTLLNMDKDVFEQDYTERYLRWCLNRATNSSTDLQKLLANRCIANYYNLHFHKLELKFIAAATPVYGSINYQIIRSMYTSITSGIFLIYPMPLFEEARKLSIINQN